MSKPLSTNQFKELMSMKKYFIDAEISLPAHGECSTFELMDSKEEEKFLLDVDRSGIIELEKIKLQNRYATNVILIRLEVNGPQHINPDGTKIGCNHIHIYSEEYGDRVAYDLQSFKDASFYTCQKFYDYFMELCKYCNIRLPLFQTVL
jgi:hypothetical protein